MRVLRAADYRRMPWKNGGGETMEVAVSPAGAGLAGFDWRVSMAMVATDGPFSRFPGVDRTLCVLDGEGLALSVAGAADFELLPMSRPYTFPADVPSSARLLGKPVTDLNVMTSRSRYTHYVARATFDGWTEVPARMEKTLIVVLSATLQCDEATLGYLDTVVLETGETAALHSDTGVGIVTVAIGPLGDQT